MQPVVIGKDARQQTKRWLRKQNCESKIIIIIPDDKEGQKEVTKHGSGRKVLFQLSEKAKQGKKAGNVRNSSKEATKDSNSTKELRAQLAALMV